jgi:hypothetical protein
MRREVYIMRIWQGSSDAENQPVTLSDTQGGQSCSFADLDKFAAFLKENLAEPPSAPNDVGTTFRSNPCWETRTFLTQNRRPKCYEGAGITATLGSKA